MLPKTGNMNTPNLWRAWGLLKGKHLLAGFSLSRETSESLSTGTISQSLDSLKTPIGFKLEIKNF